VQQSKTSQPTTRRKIIKCFQFFQLEVAESDICTILIKDTKLYNLITSIHIQTFLSCPKVRNFSFTINKIIGWFCIFY
jgi:hypothetical protein